MDDVSGNKLAKTKKLFGKHFITGGTIDSVWAPESDTAVPNDPTKEMPTRRYLKHMSSLGAPNWEPEVIFSKDSRDISIEMKAEVARTVCGSQFSRSLVTVGTYLAADVGDRIQRHLEADVINGVGHRVMVATSLTPIEGFAMSDGTFNLGMATAAFAYEKRGFDKGVMIVANGCITPINNVEKDLTTATYELKDPSLVLNKMDSVTIISIGGTIDAAPNSMDRLTPAQTSSVPGYLTKKVKMKLRVLRSEQLFLKNSWEITRQDMATIAEHVDAAKSEIIVITAGLFKMGEIRDYIIDNCDTSGGKKIIITGAKYPINSSQFSDAGYNLGAALGLVGILDEGVHVILAGNIIDKNQDPAKEYYTEEEYRLVKRMATSE